MSIFKEGVHPADLAIFVIVLLSTLAIGIYHACTGTKQSTTSEYFLGNRNFDVIPVSISLTASFFSSILILGFPAEAYTNGGMVWLYAVGIAIGAVLATMIFVPVFHPLHLTSVNEYLQRRYNSRFVSLLGTLSSLSGMILYTSIVYFAPATAFEAATGVPSWVSILVGSSITIIYTSIGGIKAVIWTDVFQALLMLIGLLTITIQAIIKVGSISKVWEIAEDWGRLNFINLNPDPTVRFTFWSLTIGVGFFDLNRYGTQQPAVQRYCSLASLRKARLSVLCLIPVTALMMSLAVLCGIAIFSYYTQLGCDPLKAGNINNPNQLVPHFVRDALHYPGIQGILLASLVSASLSTASSVLNSSSANLWKDVVQPMWPKLAEKWNIAITKVIVVLFGVLSTCLAFLFINIGGTVVQMVVTFSAACGGPTTSMFVLGMFFPFTNGLGASVGGLCGFIFGLWMGFGAYSINIQSNFLPTTDTNCSLPLDLTTSDIISTAFTSANPALLGSTHMPQVNLLHKFYSISYLWIATFSIIVSLIVGFIISILTGGMHGRKVSSQLFHPWVRRFYTTDADDEVKAVTIIKLTEDPLENDLDDNCVTIM